MRLGRRLEAVLGEIDGTSLLDIGCDHGKVLVAALASGRVRRAVGVDISEQSLSKARALAERAKVEAEFLRADGRDTPFGDADVLTIAGLGGLEIAAILENRVSYPGTMVFVPHQDAVELRRFLNGKGLFPVGDYTVEERGKYYDVIVVKPDKPGAAYREDELYFGKNLPATPEFADKIAARAAALAARVNGNRAVSGALRSEWEAYSKWQR